MVKLFLRFSIGGWISAFISFATTPIISNLILPEEYGKSSFILLAYNFTLQIILLGIDQSYVREYYSTKEENRSVLLQKALFIPLILSFLMCFVLLLFYKPLSQYLIGRINFEVILLLGLLTIVATAERFATLSLRMAHKAFAFSLVKISNTFVTFIVIVCYASFVSGNLLAIIYGNLAGLLISVLIVMIISRKDAAVKLGNINDISIVELLKYGIPFIPTFLIGWLFEAIDRIALKEYSTFNQMGLYSAALRIVAILTILQSTFSTFWTPVAFAAFEKNNNDSKELFSRTFQSLSAIFFIAALIVMQFKGVIILLFSDKYQDAIYIVPFLVFIPLMYTLSEITVGGINFKKKTNYHIVISIISALVSIIMVTLMVPTYGAKGAAMSAATAYITFFYCRTFFSMKFFPIDFKLSKFSIAVVILFSSAALNTFLSHDFKIVIINSCAILFIIFIYRHDLIFMRNYATQFMRKKIVD